MRLKSLTSKVWTIVSAVYHTFTSLGWSSGHGVVCVTEVTGGGKRVTSGSCGNTSSKPRELFGRSIIRRWGRLLS